MRKDAGAFCGEENEIFVDPSAGRRQTVTEDYAVWTCQPALRRSSATFSASSTFRKDW
jgi:hypothetical protein